MWKIADYGLADIHLREAHYCDVIMRAMASQITGVLIFYSTVCSGADQRKHQSSASLAFLVNSPHKGPATRKMFPFDDVIMCYQNIGRTNCYRAFL